jgi:glycosyltransferase involved in cell wall biosynthesis
MQKRVLSIAYHFPPIRVSSGIQRTLKFATYLRDHGWESSILTVHPRVYDATSPDQLGEIPDGMTVRRAFALDTAKHLSILGRYPRWLALPDRYCSWVVGGVWEGLQLIRRQKPDVIWSTFPIATAHLIGGLLHRLTGLPWIADFRDSMTEEDYPWDPSARRAYRRIEEYAVKHAAHCVFTTQGTRAMYTKRYPSLGPERCAVIPNGFDEENFADAEASSAQYAKTDGVLRLLHAGILYPIERDPSKFFQAIRRLKAAGTVSANNFKVMLRATGHDAFYRTQLAEQGIDDIVELHPGVPYRDALAEMLVVDGLLIFQASNCNHQVPAKLYEYFRAGRPILALTDPVGDTAAELRGAGSGVIVPLDNADAITDELARFLARIRAGTQQATSRAQAMRYSRAGGAADLAHLLDTASAATRGV